MPNYIEGEVILVDKPLTWTSFDVVNKIKYTLKNKFNLKKIKVGHAGTLDPLATGLLIVCTGKKTKTISSIQEQVKEYTGIINLGATTPSFDLETVPENFKDFSGLTLEEIKKAALELKGELEQTPPIFSAKKIDGKRAYDLARKGESPEMKKNRVTVFDFELTKIELPEIYFRISCTKGTYIRSIANDYGELLKVGAYLKELRRTKIGDYHVLKAQGVEKLVDDIQNIELKTD